MSKPGQEKDSISMNIAYRDNFEHIAAELRNLDLLVRLRLAAFSLEPSEEGAVPLDPRIYVSREEVEALLQEEAGNNDTPAGIQEILSQIEALRQEIDTRVSVSMESGVFLALPHLARLFNLSPLELQVVVICLAPELRRKYDKIFVYLQDDIARKKPSIDLVLDLLCETETGKWRTRGLFSAHAPLYRSGILQVSEDLHSPSGSSGLAGFLTLDTRILNFLLGNNSIDKRLADSAVLYEPPLSSKVDDLYIHRAIRDRLINITHGCPAASEPGSKKWVLHFYGPYGVGKRDLALEICRQSGCFLLYLDMERLAAKEPETETLLRLAFREGLLREAVLFIDNIDVLLTGELRSKALLKSLARMAAEHGGLTILAGEKPWPGRELSPSPEVHSIGLVVPAVQLRQLAWEKVLGNLVDEPGPGKNAWAAELARQFRLTPGQIRDAAQFANNHFKIGEQKKITLNHLYTACRKQSNQKLTELAMKIEPGYRWQDIVLPDEKLSQLKEICSQVKYRHQVFDQWGFEEKLSHGKGLSVLFSGAPGTGKTMAAEVMAHDLQLDLYKIDLSRVVSKYIGETEKNLARVFHEAETSNAILFFDEADALFGKRTEVTDAHDRYANIETSYLLQKMEEYEGVVILASNFRKNMDEAFSRRLRFIVEFPFPDEGSRLWIWKTHFPAEAPVSKEIDYEFLAKQFQVAGGSIRNIVLGAAFFAAQDGGTIVMKHILNGARREYEKIGKLWPRGAKSLIEEASA